MKFKKIQKVLRKRMNKKAASASIDIDSGSVKRLLLSLKKLLDLGLKIERVEISPSKTGFHIIVSHPDLTLLDVIAIKALADSDPYALRFAIKRLALDSIVDICFERKGMSKERESIPIDIDLNELKQIDIKDIKSLNKLVEKYEKELKPMMKKTFMTIFEIPDEREDEIKEILGDIADKDKSFRYKVYPNLYKDGKTKKIAVVFSKDEDTAHKRGMWFKHKVGIDSYWVKTLERKI